MTTLYDFDKKDELNRRQYDELKNAAAIFKEYMAEHTAKNGGRKCHCHECQLAEAWLQRNR